MLADAVVALIRTFVPTLVGLFLSLLVSQGITLDPELETSLTLGLMAAMVAGYYALVTLLERKVHPAFGWLLGMAKAPAYSKAGPPAEAPVVVDREAGAVSTTEVAIVALIIAVVLIVVFVL